MIRSYIDNTIFLISIQFNKEIESCYKKIGHTILALMILSSYSDMIGMR